MGTPHGCTIQWRSAKPYVDRLTLDRLQLVRKLLPSNTETAQTFDRKEPVLVPLINGTHVKVDGDSLTTTDMLRTFVAETTRDRDVARLAEDYMCRMQLQGKESCSAAAYRALQYNRAADVDPDHPYQVETRYYFRTIRTASFMRLGGHIIGVLGGQTRRHPIIKPRRLAKPHATVTLDTSQYGRSAWSHHAQTRSLGRENVK